MADPPKVISSSKIYHDYFISEVDAEPFLRKLNLYFEHDPHNHNIEPNEVERIIQITEVSLKHFDNRSVVNQNLLIDFSKKLLSIKNTHKADKQKSILIERLVIAYKTNVHLHKKIQQSLSAISILLTPAAEFHVPSLDKLKIAEKIIPFAIDFFQDLPYKTQFDLQRIKKLFEIEQPEIIEKNEHYINLRKIVVDIPKIIQSSSSSQSSSQSSLQFKVCSVESDDSDKEELFIPEKKGLLSKATSFVKRAFKEKSKVSSQEVEMLTFYEIPSLSSSTTEKQYLCEVAKKNARLEKQLNPLYEFFQRFSTHYFSKYIFNQPHSIQLALLFEQQMTLLIPNVGRSILVQEPRVISRIEKQLIIGSLFALNQFLADFTKSCNSPNISDTLYDLIRQRANIPKEKPFGPDLMQCQLVDFMNSIIEYIAFDTINQNQDLTKLQLFKEAIISIPAVDFLNRMLYPDRIAFILDRIINGTAWDVVDDSESSSTMAASAFDTVFTKELGSLIEELAGQFLLFGQLNGVANSVSKIFMKVLKLKQENIGFYLQKKLNEITGSECCVEPIRFLDLILFEKVNNQQNPTLFAFLNKSDEERAQFRSKLRRTIEEEVIPKFIERIKEESKTMTFLSMFDSSKSFCKTITERLFLLLDNEMLIKALAFYLLNGVKRSLKIELNRINADRHDGVVSTPISYLN